MKKILKLILLLLATNYVFSLKILFKILQGNNLYLMFDDNQIIKYEINKDLTLKEIKRFPNIPNNLKSNIGDLIFNITENSKFLLVSYADGKSLFYYNNSWHKSSLGGVGKGEIYYRYKFVNLLTFNLDRLPDLQKNTIFTNIMNSQIISRKSFIGNILIGTIIKVLVNGKIFYVEVTKIDKFNFNVIILNLKQSYLFWKDVDDIIKNNGGEECFTNFIVPIYTTDQDNLDFLITLDGIEWHRYKLFTQQQKFSLVAPLSIDGNKVPLFMVISSNIEQSILYTMDAGLSWNELLKTECFRCMRFKQNFIFILNNHKLVIYKYEHLANGSLRFFEFLTQEIPNLQVLKVDFDENEQSIYISTTYNDPIYPSKVLKIKTNQDTNQTPPNLVQFQGRDASDFYLGLFNLFYIENTIYLVDKQGNYIAYDFDNTTKNLSVPIYSPPPAYTEEDRAPITPYTDKGHPLFMHYEGEPLSIKSIIQSGSKLIALTRGSYLLISDDNGSNWRILYKFDKDYSQIFFLNESCYLRLNSGITHEILNCLNGNHILDITAQDLVYNGIKPLNAIKNLDSAVIGVGNNGYVVYIKSNKRIEESSGSETRRCNLLAVDRSDDVLVAVGEDGCIAFKSQHIDSKSLEFNTLRNKDEELLSLKLTVVAIDSNRKKIYVTSADGKIIEFPYTLNEDLSTIHLDFSSTQINKVEGAHFNAIAVNLTGTIVAVGDEGLIYYSNDGQNWNKVTLVNNHKINSIHVINNTFVIGGENNILYWSEDGRKWVKSNILNPININ